MVNGIAPQDEKDKYLKPLCDTIGGGARELMDE